MAGTAGYYAKYERQREQRRGTLERVFYAECMRAKVTGQFLCSNDSGNLAVAAHARLADLVIAGQTDPNDPESYIDDHFAEHLVMAAGRPVLLIPYAGVLSSIGKQILVAWDGSREAARSAYDALPFLARAGQSTVVTVRGTAGETTGARIAGADIALTLARHDATVDVLELDGAADTPVGDTLLSCALERACDLIVMGGVAEGVLRIARCPALLTPAQTNRGRAAAAACRVEKELS
jgi:nucleotide-binding universal stress UspA family protein